VKRLTPFAIALFLSALFPFVSRGQSTLAPLIEGDDSPSASDSTPPQRIGAPASEFHLSSNQSGSVNGFCFDEYLIAPRRVMNYRNVLAGNNDAVVRTSDGTTMTLADAIKRGTIAVHAMQLRLTFTNRSSEPVAIEMRHPAVFWDRPGGDVNPEALRVLESPNEDYDWRQNMVWRITTSERMLAVTGYYDGSVWNIDRDRFQRAVKHFQNDNGMPANGELDQATMARLSNASTTLASRLAKAGFVDYERHSLRPDLAAQINAYQAYLEARPTRQWSPELDRQLKGNEEMIRQVAALRNDPRPVDEALKDGGPYPDVITYLNGPKGVLALVQASKGIELWCQRGGSFYFEGRDRKAAAKLDDAAAQLAARATKGDNIVIYPRPVVDAQMKISIGDTYAYMDAAGVNGYLQGGEIPAVLARNVGVFAGSSGDVTGGATPKNVVVYRGPLSQGRLADPHTAPALRSKLGIATVDGALLANALDRTYGDSMALYVSDDLRTGATRLHPAAGQGKL